MPDQQTHVFNIPDFLAGVHTYALWDKRPLNSLEKAKNCVFDRAGFLKRRPGLDQVGSVQTAAVSHRTVALIAAYQGSSRKLVHVFRSNENSPTIETGISGWDGSNWKNILGNGYDLYSISTSFTPIIPCVVNNNGTEQVHVFRGGTIALSINSNLVTTQLSLTSRKTSGAFFSMMFLGREWVCGKDDSDRDLLWYSPIDVPHPSVSTYDTNIIRFDREYVMALARFRDNVLFVGTDSSTYLLIVGQSNLLLDWENRLISPDIGVGSAVSVISGLNDIFFLDNTKNIRRLAITLSNLSSTINPLPLSYPIKNKIEDICGASIDYFNSAFYDGKYFANGHTSTIDGTTGQSWCYDSFVEAWTGPFVYVTDSNTVDAASNILYSAQATGPFGSSNLIFTERARDLYFAVLDKVDVKNRVMKWTPTQYSDDSGDTGSTARTIPVEIITRPHDFGVPHQQKIVKWIEIDYGDESTAFSGTGSFDVYMKKDFAAAWTQVGSAVNYTSSTKFARTRIDTQTIGRGKVFQARIVDTSTTDGPKIRSMRFAFQAIPVGDD